MRPPDTPRVNDRYTDDVHSPWRMGCASTSGYPSG